MARTHRDKPKRDEKLNGPVLLEQSETATAVLEPAPEPETEGEEEEREEDQQPESTAADPRRIPPAPQLQADQFFAFIAQIPDPANFDIYVYRLEPVIKAMRDPQLPPNKRQPTYSEKVKGLIAKETGRTADFDWLKFMRGSGKYHITLNDRTLKRTREHQVCECLCQISEWDTHPPILNDWSELVDCDANKWFIDRMIREKVIARSAEGRFISVTQTQAAEAAPNPSDPSAILTQTVNLAKDLARTMAPRDTAPGFTGKDIVDLIGKTQIANDPQKIIDAATSLIQMTKPAEDKSGDTLITLLLAQLEEQRKESAAARAREFELMKEMLQKANTPPPAPPPPPDPVTTIKAQAEAYVTLREAFGGGEAESARSRMNGWQEFLKEPLNGFIGLLQPFAQVGAAVLAAKAQQAAQPQNGQPRATTPAPTSPAVTQQQPQQQQPGAAPGQPQQQTTTPPAQETQQPMPPAPDPVLVILNAALMHVDFTLRDYFANELTGGEFAGWFCDTAIPLPAPYNLMQESVIGAEALKKLQAFTATDPQGQKLEAPEAGKQLLVAAYRANPAIWAKIVTSPDKEPKFLRFLDEFLAYNPEGEPAPAQAKGAKRP